MFVIYIMYRCAIVSVNVTVMMVLVLLTVHSPETEAVTIATQRGTQQRVSASTAWNKMICYENYNISLHRVS